MRTNFLPDGIARFVFAGLLGLLLAACGGGGGAGGASGHATVVSGTVMGGLTPIAGSSITLYAAGSAGTGPTTIGTAVSHKDGSFKIAAAQPGASEFLYLVAKGGDAGGGNNSAIGLMSVLGPQASFPASASINELTSVAAAFALSNFISSEVDIEDSTIPELANTMPTIEAMVNPQTGVAGPIITNADNSVLRFNTLGNVLAGCVQATASAAPCTNLFAAADLPSQPADTLGAIINIGAFPGNNGDTITNLALINNPPYSPALPGVVPEVSIGLTFTAGGQINGPMALAIDANGDIWVSNHANNTVAWMDRSGTALSPAGGFTGAGLNSPQGLAIDSSRRVWVANNAGTSVTEIDPGTQPATVTEVTGGQLQQPFGVAVDTTGVIWVTNATTPASLTEINPKTQPFTLTNFADASLSQPEGIAIDSQNFVWTANVGNNSAVELVPGIPDFVSFTDASFNLPVSVAIDQSDRVWIANLQGKAGVTEFDPKGMPVSFTNITGADMISVNSIAIDGAGHAWTVNGGTNSVSEITSAGAVVAPGHFNGANFNGAIGTAIDGAGDLWVANQSGNSVSELVGIANGIATPLNGPPVAP